MIVSKTILYLEYLNNYITVDVDNLNICQQLRILYSNFMVDKPVGNNIGTIHIECLENQVIISNENEKVGSIIDGWVQKFNKIFQETILFALKKNYLFFHSTSVSFGDKAILFAGTSGSGKTSCALYLAMTKKWDFVGDDFLPIDISDNNLHSFPGCIHAKQSMIDLLGVKIRKNNCGVSYVGVKNKILYFPPSIVNVTQTNKKFKNLIFVFPRYNSLENTLKKLNGIDKIAHFMECIYNIDDIVSYFAPFVSEQQNCYFVQYSNFEYLDRIIESIVIQ